MSWSCSTPQQKFEQAIRSAQSRKGVAISCNLSEARERALIKASNPTWMIGECVGYCMKQKLGYVLPFAVQFEFTVDGRLHIHGVVLLDRATGAELNALKDSLARACGKVPGKPGSPG